MDCFKLQAETLQYLSEQKKNFTNIIEVLSYISQIDDQILQFFPIDKQFSQVQEFIYDRVRGERESQQEPEVSVGVLKLGEESEEQKQINPGRSKIIEISSRNLIQQTIDEKKEKRMSGKSIRSRKFEKEKAFENDYRDKINQQNESTKQKTSTKSKVNFIKTTCLFDLFWATLTQKCINKQQKYVLILDTAYAYFKINLILNKNKSEYSSDAQIRERSKNELIQQQFHKFIQQNSGSNSNLNNLPMLVKLCHRLNEINEYVRVHKDLITVRKMCLDMKKSILDELPKQVGKEAQRQEYINTWKQKYENSKNIKPAHLNSLASQISINNSISPSQRDSIKKNKDQSSFEIQNLQRRVNKILLQMNRQKLFFKLRSVRGVQTYYHLFLWRLDSSIIIINEILNKETIYKKQEFLKYLKMGKWIRDTYICQKISPGQDVHQNPKGECAQIVRQNTVIELKTRRMMPDIVSFGQVKRYIKNKFILQKLLYTYSSIAKYSKKLKESKYFDMLIMELQITYRYLFKANKKMNNNFMKNAQYFNQLMGFQQSLQINMKDIFDFDGKNQKKSLPKSKVDPTAKKVQFIGIPDPLEQEKLTKRSKQKTSKKSLKSMHDLKEKKNIQFNPISYQQIHKQILQEQTKNEKQVFKNYFKQDSHTQAEQNFLELVHENKRRSNFTKSLDYITNRSSKTPNQKGKFYSKNSTHSTKGQNERSTMNYHINLDQVMKDQFCQQNAQKLKMNKTNRRFVRKGNQQSISGQLTYKHENKNQIETFNKQTGQVFVLAKRSIKKYNQNGANSENTTPSANPNPSFQFIKMKKRLGTLDRRHSFKKQIMNLISITKRNIKPGRYFNQIKDAQNNRYRAILSTEQRVTVLNKERLLDQISYMHEVNYEKAHPTHNQILIATGSVSQKNSVNNGEHEDSYSIKGIGSSTGLNISFHSKKLQLTMIQGFGRAIGFLNIKMLANSKVSEYEVIYTCYLSKLLNQNLIVSTINKNLQFVNTQHKNAIKQDRIVYKSCFSLQELKKQIVNSEFYFELIQENLQKNIDGSDIYMIAQYFNYLEHQNSDHNFISIFPNSSSIYQNKDTNTENQGLTLENTKLSMNLNWKANWEKSLEEKEKANKIQSLVFAFTQRISQSLLYWYYTKGVKITGSILLKRQIPYISDPLKFAIALDFMKKYTHKQCLQKLSNVRNKKALYQCFRYLFFGRKILVKDFLIKKNVIMFYTLSLEKFYDSQFRIRTKEQGGSEFKDLVFTLTLYNKNAELLIQKYEYPVHEVLSSKQITLLMLNNIIQQQINPKYVYQLLMDVEAKESSSIPKNLRQSGYFQHGIKQENCEQQNLESQNLFKSKPHNESSLQKIIQQLNHKIRNFGNLLLLYVDIIEGSVNLAVINSFKKVIKVKQQYYLIQQIYLRCGLVLHVICRASNKDQILHITIYQIKDLTSLLKKLKHEETKRAHMKKIEQKKRKQNQALMKLKSMNQDKKKAKKTIRTFSHQNHNNGRSIEKSRNTYSPEKIENEQNSNHKNLAQPTQSKGDTSKVSELVNAYEYKYEVINKNINESFLEYNPMYKKRKSAYHSRIVVSCPNNPKRNLINKINKCIIEKQEMDWIEMINQSEDGHNQNKNEKRADDMVQKYVNRKVKRVLKLNNKYIYISILFNQLIKAYRIDLYEVSSSNRYSAYFRLQQFGINQHFITNYLNLQTRPSPRQQEEIRDQSKAQKQHYDTYYNHNYFSKKESMSGEESKKTAKILILKKDISIKRQIYHCNYLLSQFMNNNLEMDRSNSMIFSSTNTLDLRPDAQKKQDQALEGYNKQINQKYQWSYWCKEKKIDEEYNYRQNVDRINMNNLFVLHLLNYNRFLISQDFKSITFQMGSIQNEGKSMHIPLFPTFNNLSSFEGRNMGKIQLIEMNSKLYLLIILQNEPHLYLTEVDDNPYMNNVNLFADFKAKEHLVNLYTDLFMRMYVKFVGSKLTGKFYPKIRDIGNTI